MALLGSRFSLREAQKLNLVVRPIIDDETAFVFQWGRYWTITWSNWHLQDSAFLTTHVSCKSLKKKKTGILHLRWLILWRRKLKCTKLSSPGTDRRVIFCKFNESSREFSSLENCSKLQEHEELSCPRPSLVGKVWTRCIGAIYSHALHFPPWFMSSLICLGPNSTLGRNLPIFWWRERESWAIVQTNPSLMENHHLSLFCWLT